MNNEYTIYKGIEHLTHLDTAISITFDCETLQLQPERGKLRLLQLGCKVRKVLFRQCCGLKKKHSLGVFFFQFPTRNCLSGDPFHSSNVDCGCEGMGLCCFLLKEPVLDAQRPTPWDGP